MASGDDLKPVHDRYGYAGGDLVIRSLARASRSLARAGDSAWYRAKQVRKADVRRPS